MDKDDVIATLNDLIETSREGRGSERERKGCAEGAGCADSSGRTPPDLSSRPLVVRSGEPGCVSAGRERIAWRFSQIDDHRNE